MKFGKSLSNQIDETLPEWRDKFLSYKDLKKKLKLLEPKGGERPTKRPRFETGDPSDGDGMDASGDGKESRSKEEIDFGRLLENELDKFNTFFVEKEEEYIIRLKVFFQIFLTLTLRYLRKIMTSCLLAKKIFTYIW